jgi:hypothetical protein
LAPTFVPPEELFEPPAATDAPEALAGVVLPELDPPDELHPAVNKTVAVTAAAIRERLFMRASFGLSAERKWLVVIATRGTAPPGEVCRRGSAVLVLAGSGSCPS